MPWDSELVTFEYPGGDTVAVTAPWDITPDAVDSGFGSAFYQWIFNSFGERRRFYLNDLFSLQNFKTVFEGTPVTPGGATIELYFTWYPAKFMFKGQRIDLEQRWKAQYVPTWNPVDHVLTLSEADGTWIATVKATGGQFQYLEDYEGLRTRMEGLSSFAAKVTDVTINPDAPDQFPRARCLVQYRETTQQETSNLLFGTVRELIPTQAWATILEASEELVNELARLGGDVNAATRNYLFLETEYLQFFEVGQTIMRYGGTDAAPIQWRLIGTSRTSRRRIRLYFQNDLAA